MNYEIRIIAGSLRGRKVRVSVDARLRPMADRPRAALFSILGNAVPDRPFFDVFAGTGAVGMEALSRGASRVVFVERDGRTADAIQDHLRRFGVNRTATQVIQADAYRWGDKGALPREPVNVFVGPPYEEFDKHYDAIKWLVVTLMDRTEPGSVLSIQSDQVFPADLLPDSERWDVRKYGRTQLAIWVKPFADEPDAVAAEAQGEPAA